MSFFSRLFGDVKKRPAMASQPPTAVLPADWNEMGVTGFAPAKPGCSKRHIPGDISKGVRVWIQPLDLMLDASVLEGSPVPIGTNGTQMQHRLCPRHFPTHPGAFHAVLDDVTTGALDDSSCNRISAGQVLIVTHAMQIALQELAQLPQTFFGRAAQLVLGAHLRRPPMTLPAEPSST